MTTYFINMIIKLYHGTSEENYSKIMASGFLDPIYLTSNDEQAQYYAEVCSDDDESSPVILTVEVDTAFLMADTSSFDEPLSYTLQFHGLSEKDWHEAITSGEIEYPDKDRWDISLETTQTVKTTQAIDIKNIQYDGSLNDDDYKNINKAIQTFRMDSSLIKKKTVKPV